MKIYIAGKLGEEGSVQELMEYIRGLGHEITFDWTKIPNLKPFESNIEATIKCAMDEVSGVKNADLVILLCSDTGVGMFVEFGVAIGNNIPVYVVTNKPARTGFFYHPLARMIPDINAIKHMFNP